MRKVFIATLFAALGAAAFAASIDSTPDGCVLGNGGSEPVCVPTVQGD